MSNFALRFNSSNSYVIKKTNSNLYDKLINSRWSCKSCTPKIEDFKYTVDRFADIEILRYRVPCFEKLSLKQKKLVYYLNEAALEGRDILYDQNNKYNLCVRHTLEAVYLNYNGNRKTTDFRNLTTNLKRVWM